MAFKTPKPLYPTTKVAPMNKAAGPFGESAPNSPRMGAPSSVRGEQERIRRRYRPAAAETVEYRDGLGRPQTVEVSPPEPLGMGRLVDPGTEALGGGRIVPSGGGLAHPRRGK